MSIGANMSVITAGAILAFATRIRLEGISIPSVGMVLMLVGVVGLVLQLASLRRRRRLTALRAATPPEAVLVRPGAAPGSAAQAPSGHAGTTSDYLRPGEELTPEQIRSYSSW